MVKAGGVPSASEVEAGLLVVEEHAGAYLVGCGVAAVGGEDGQGPWQR